MAIHIGKLIQAEVERQRLTYKEFGALINKNEKTVPDIYERAFMSIDLLITISAALKKDFLSLYYTDEPMKILRDDEIAHLNNQIEKFKEQIENIAEEKYRLQRVLALTQNLVESQKDALSFAKELVEHYKSQLMELSNKDAITLVKRTG